MWMCVIDKYVRRYVVIFFFNETATTEIYTYGHTLSLHDALPIFCSLCFMCSGLVEMKVWMRPRWAGLMASAARSMSARVARASPHTTERVTTLDRKSTRLNSSH